MNIYDKNGTPILFGGAMVRAILEGRKTQTRRICKPRFDDKKPCEHFAPVEHDVGPSMERHCEHGSESTPCPYGVVGDRLWVRETWRSHDVACAIKRTIPLVRYRADGGFSCGCKPLCTEPGGPWKPSIFMPRWASRIMLEVTGVRVERVQEITEEDARAEGIVKQAYGYGVVGLHMTLSTAREAFWTLWDSIKAGRGCGWDVNPWVWVVEFKRVNQ